MDRGKDTQPVYRKGWDTAWGEAIVEQLGAYAHEAWGGWMRYLFSKGTLNMDGSFTIPSELRERWWRQLNTSYALLPESERESDRVEARKMLKIIGAEQIDG
jgi:hypothetical protein